MVFIKPLLLVSDSDSVVVWVTVFRVRFPPKADIRLGVIPKAKLASPIGATSIAQHIRKGPPQRSGPSFFLPSIKVTL